MIKIRKLLSNKLSTSQKKLLLTLERKLNWRNLIFIVTIGAVRKDTPKIKVTRLANASNKSESKLENLLKYINDANKNIFWPVRRKLRFIDGMSGQSYRSVLNKLAGEGNRYLEIGTWKGSTACSVLDGNEIDVFLVDNWSEFGGPAKDALKNISKFAGGESRITVISNEFRQVKYEHLLDGPVDTYLFDGPHSREDHVNGVRVIDQLQFDTLVFVVDD